MDLMSDAIDYYINARNLIHEVDPEIEAIVSAHLGRIYYQGLRKNEKAKKFYLDSLRMLETLKPKTFNQEKWHQTMTKHMDEIEKASLSADDAKRTAEEA